MDYTQAIGNVNELKCMLAIMQLGYDCSIPYGNASKYDFIADINGELLRFQCKSSHFVSDHGVTKTDAFQFNTSCQTTNTRETKRYRYNSDQIDYFITCFQDKVYVVPVEECSSSKTLRLSPPSTNQGDWNDANDYLLENYFPYSNHYLQSKESYENRSIPEATKSFCQNCGKEISSKASFCSDCYNMRKRIIERPSREELKDLIRTQSFTQIGKRYSVSDNCIRKWCKSYNLPTRSGDIKKISNDEWINV